MHSARSVGIRSFLSSLAVPLALMFALPGCRPVVRACSRVDRCVDGSRCVGGRCEQSGPERAIDDAQRVELGGESALLVAFDGDAAIPTDRIVEAHLLLRRPETLERGLVRVHRMTAPWDERSTPPADALGHIGMLESEVPIEWGGPALVRLPVSRRSVATQREAGWAVQLDPNQAATLGAMLASSTEAGPRLELYLRKAPPGAR